MDIAEKKRLIERYRRAGDELEAIVAGLEAEALDFVPPIEGAWPIRAQVAHVLDADMICWGRFRKIVAQREAAVELWDQEAWAARLDYGTVDFAKTLARIRELREALADFLDSKAGEDWESLVMIHPERGRRNLAEVVGQYADHIGFHVRLIERNLRAFRERKG
jgi:hypothetical protein